MNNAIRVFTFHSVEQTLVCGGAGDWKVVPERAARCEYAILARNARDLRLPPGANEAHRSVFMVGKISGVVPAPDRPGRYVLRFSEYALVNVPEACGLPRNPVQYCNFESMLGIDPATLNWQPMPAGEPPIEPAATPDLASLIRQAKAIVASYPGVQLGMVDINIRW
jgi:hypothetical protein